MKATLELYKGKKLIDNSYPIVVRLYHNGKLKYKSTSISVKDSHWNKKKTRITCREHNYVIKNTIINNEYQRICQRINWFADNHIDYDLDFIVSNKQLELYSTSFEPNFDPNNFLCIIDKRIDECTKSSTRDNYCSFKRTMINLYGDYIPTKNINQAFANEFRIKIHELYPNKPNHKNHLFKCFNTSYKLGVRDRFILNPCTFQFKYFPYQSSSRIITYQDLSTIIACYKDKLQQNKDFLEYEPLALFILDVAFQGLSPMDLALIKVGQIEFDTLNSIEKNTELYKEDPKYAEKYDKENIAIDVIKINTFRAKNNRHVPICTELKCIFPIIKFLMEGKTKDDYLINCYSYPKFNNYSDAISTSEDKRWRNRCGVYFMNQKKILQTIINEYCSENYLNQFGNITYYFARHAFINALDHINIDHDLIRKMVGHSKFTLENNYINAATDFEQASIIKSLFETNKSVEQMRCEALGDIYVYSEYLDFKNKFF